MKKLFISVCILLLAVGGILLYLRWREAHTLYQAEPPASYVSEADGVTLAEGENWIPWSVDVITSDRYYWKDWKRQLNGTESETLYYARQESWDAFVKKAHARELKFYEWMHSCGIFHTHNTLFCVVEQNYAGLQPEVEAVSQLVKENGKSKVTLYVSYTGEGVEGERMTYYYFVKLPQGLPQVEELVISTDRSNREAAEANE